MWLVPNGFTLFREDLEHVNTTLDEDWSLLRGANIFVTGGTGFFGVHLVECLLWANARRGLGIRLTILTRSPEVFRRRRPDLNAQPNVRLLQGDITNFVMPCDAFTHILHCASEANLIGAKHWAKSHLSAAIDGTYRIIELARKSNAECLLITSSGAVYNQSDQFIDNRWVEGPSGPADYISEKSVYSQSKRIMEVMISVSAESAGFRAIIARCFAFIGPYLVLNQGGAIGNFIDDILKTRPIVVNGDGTPIRSYLYTADLVIWLLRCVTKGRNGVAYNIGAEEPISIGAMARIINNIEPRTSDVIIKGRPDKGTAPQHYLPSIARAKSELGLEVWIGLDEAVRRTVAWHRARIKL